MDQPRYNASVRFTAISISLVFAVSGVPDLTDFERAQLDLAVDHDDRFDGPAMLPLLRHAVQWTSPIDSRGATIPDYARMIEDPTTRRGRLYFIEGRLARVVKTAPLARSGPWDAGLREWDVLVGAEGGSHTAVVFLVDAGDAPPIGTDVSIVARFYKVMRRKDVRQGDWTDFPLFVGHSAAATGSSTPPSEGNPVPAGLMVVVLLLLVGYVLVRRMTVGQRRRPAGPDRAAHRHVRPTLAAASADRLPEDSVQALEALRQRVEREERQDGIDGGSDDQTA